MNFLFTCDNCITKFETERAASSSDKFVRMQNQIDDLHDNISEIKDFFLVRVLWSKRMHLHEQFDIFLMFAYRKY